MLALGYRHVDWRARALARSRRHVFQGDPPMSYPAPPPPGGAGPNPYQAPAGAAGFGAAPQKKDNTLWWILGIIAAVIILCLSLIHI